MEEKRYRSWFILSVIIVIVILMVASHVEADKKSNSKSSGPSSTGTSKTTGAATTDSKGPAKKLETTYVTTSNQETTEEKTKTVEKQENTFTYLDENQEEIKVTLRTETKTKDGETFQKIKVRGVEAVSELELKSEEEKIKTKLSNGNTQEIKIMPNTASETAIEKLKTNKDLTIQLKEVGEGNDLSVVYDIEGERTVKFLGLFKVRTELRARVDAETGEIIEFETPWWYFFVGKEIVIPKCDSEHIDLCETLEDCETNGGYWYDEFCNLEPQIVCDLEHLDLCVTLEECEAIGAYWYDDICNAELQIEEPPINQTAVENNTQEAGL